LIRDVRLDRMTTNQGLAEQIEQLVRDHLAANRAAVAAAVERAFAGANAVAGSDARPSRATSADARPKARARARAKPAPRRAVEEVVALGERFYAALCRSPGEPMTTLAPQVGASPRALQVAVTRLKRAGRVRAVGQRQGTRYFPMTTTPAAAA
jgi:hypothetical protein